MFFYSAFPIVIAGTAVIMDLRTAKVDNGWIVFSLVTGGLIQGTFHGAAGIWSFAAGAVLPAMLLGSLFVFRMLGPGDIKLFCALGGIMGPLAVLRCIAGAMLMGAGIALAILCLEGEFCSRFLHFFYYVRDYIQTGCRKSYYQTGMNSYENFHFTVPIFMSVLLYAGGFY